MSLDELKSSGEVPNWMDEFGLKTLQGGYLQENETPKAMYMRVAKAAASYYSDALKWETKFFDAMWNNWLCPASPVLSNLGTNRGLPISCNSIHVGDSVDSIFTKNYELATLSKNGAGVGIYFGDIRGRGVSIKGNGKSEGIIPWCKVMDQTTVSISQGSTRRGASAIYLPIDHLDIEEFMNVRRPTGDVNRRCLNINHGVCISDAWMESMLAGDAKKRKTWEELLRTRVETGEPYIFFSDNVNKNNPECYVKNGLDVKTSNICSEICLYTDTNHTFVCCLSSLNLVRWDEWKDTDLPNIAVRFLDAVLSEYIKKTENMKGMEASRASAIKGRAIGIGVLGWHTLLQERSLPFDSFDTMQLNAEIFRTIRTKAEEETALLAKELGEPEWCKGFNRRNTHTCVSPDTELLTKQGFKSIKELVGQEINIWNGHEWSVVSPYKTSDDSEMMEVILSDGSTLKTTLDHKWLIKNNRFRKSIIKETKNLVVGDKLEKWDQPIIEGIIDFPHAYTHGFYCGDGSDNQSKPQYTNCKKRKEVRLYNDDKKCLTMLEVKNNCSIRTQKNGSLRFYIPDEMPTKFVVPDITHTLRSRLEWLSGLCDADGTIKSGQITSADFDFLKRIKDMLAYSGIFAKISKYKRSGGYQSSNSHYYSLIFSSAALNKSMVNGYCPKRAIVRHSKINKQQYVQIVSIKKISNSDTYCLTEQKRGTALFNGIKTKQCAVAPTVSNSTISGGHSAGIEPLAANIFVQKSAKGTFIRKNRTLEALLDVKGQNTPEIWKSINEQSGSVQHLKFLSDHEKEVFLTAREINQHTIIKLAVQRQRWVDQAQSVNLFFASNSSPKYIHEVHLAAWKNGLKTLYYFRSDGVIKSDLASRSEDECKACEA